MAEHDLAEVSHVSNWVAKRAGAGITVVGSAHPTQLPVKITNVERIECIETDGIFAILKDNGGVVRLRGAKKP